MNGGNLNSSTPDCGKNLMTEYKWNSLKKLNEDYINKAINSLLKSMNLAREFYDF